MTEEEKKIISQIKDVAQYRTIIQHGDGHGTIAWIPRLEQTMVINNYTAKVVYDLIEKQQKEIETLENRIANQDKEIKLMKSVNINEEIERDFISKAEIRDKIKKLEKLYEKEMKPYRTEFGLNLSLLTKKEKEEVINKRNSLLIAITTLKELLKEKKYE